MDAIQLFIKNLFQLISNKKLAAVICITCVLLHLATCYPAQFPQLAAFCHNHLYLIDITALATFASLAVHGICHLYTRLASYIKKKMIYRSAMKVIKSILQTPGSEKYIIVIHLYYCPDTSFNYMTPDIKYLCDSGVICPTSEIPFAKPNGTYTLPYNLTDAIRQYMNSHSQELPPRNSSLSTTPYNRT